MTKKASLKRTLCIGQVWKRKSDQKSFLIINVWRKDGTVHIKWLPEGNTEVVGFAWMRRYTYPTVVYVDG